MAITAVDGRPVQEVLEHDLYPYVFASSPQARDGWAYPLLVDGPRGTKASLEVQDLEGATRSVTLTRDLQGVTLPWKDRSGPEAGELPGSIMNVPLNSFTSDETVRYFESQFDRISKAEGLILDLRRNTGGSTGNGYAIIRYLTDKALPTSRWRTRQYRPFARACGDLEQWFEGNMGVIEPVEGRLPFRGPIVVLVGADTISAGEDFLIPLHASHRATLVGQRTNGSTGQPLTISLPGGGGAMICTKWDSYPDGREFVGVGVIPDVPVYPTQREIADGLWADENDPILEKGLEVLRSQL
jgi:C-terminal processing protease CtpA/Prc